jgi:hypothetical protein
MAHAWSGQVTQRALVKYVAVGPTGYDTGQNKSRVSEYPLRVAWPTVLFHLPFVCALSFPPSMEKNRGCSER